ncbi:ZYBA0S13-01508g1_1 [Zygosaccharomyces bailii CLIB 213]|uniref:ZYBA0S13-01508g1_1 n=1 Tax=Zygosaccharomyces bailii (strain CLIB 213 / ATCC 58445 / CBS 680 / BCRC 21525 / NBRC 1098 / NCYC 1416 / NRRL Y-2227) TaxID=1333698 RepID=A0A8J2XE94_ZYGB2|nr:ZYBA0S13-01508g1_1 [Zygosaccharomyces bailii CLIB 213]
MSFPRALKTLTRFYSSAMTLQGLNGTRLGTAAVDGGRILKTFFDKNSTTITFVRNDLPEHKPYTVTFNNLFLRDSSRSPKSMDPESGQKLFTTGQLARNPMSITPKLMQIVNDGQSLRIDWEDGDSYNYPLDFIYSFKGSTFFTEAMRKSSSRHKPVLWDSALLRKHEEELAGTDFESFLNDEHRLYECLKTLQRFGIVFIKGIPADDQMAVKRIAQKIGPIRNTFYGETFDVRSDSGTTSNIAYSNLSLPLHMDLLYMENVPGFQLLHAINNPKEGTGGVNIFVDAFRAARHVREHDALAYEALQHVPVNYQYIKGELRYYQSRPMIEHYDTNEENTLEGYYENLIKRVSYSPPFQAPFSFGIYEKSSESNVSASKVGERFLFKDFADGLELFEDCIEQPESRLEVKIPAGTCVLFNNTRVLHARTAYLDDSRWLKGCYLDADTFMSKLKYLEEKFV